MTVHWSNDPDRIEYRGVVVVKVAERLYAVWNTETGNRLTTAADISQARRTIDSFLSYSTKEGYWWLTS